MEGLIHRVSIYRRITVGGNRQWETTPFIEDYPCRIDWISPKEILREQFASCDHSAVGEANTDIEQGMRMVVTGTGWPAGKTFSIVGARQLDAGVPGPHHTELMLKESRLPEAS